MWSWISTGLKVAVVSLIAAGTVYLVRFGPMQAESHHVVRTTVVEELLGTGTLEARVNATISSKISGRIQSILVDQGETVVAGAEMVMLEDDELQQQVAIAEANRDAALAGVERFKVERQRAQAVAKQAQRAFQRVETLMQQNAVSQEEVDKATEAVAVASAGIASVEAAIIEAEKQLHAADESLEYQRARLADTRIKAPFDGLIVRRSRETGDVVVPGTSILTLIDLEELWVSAWVDETAISKLQVGQPARVIFRSSPTQEFEGKVVRIGKETDRETRELLVDVHVLQLPDNWAVGQRAEVYIETSRVADAIALPNEYLQINNQDLGVLIFEDGKARWQPIELGVRGQNLAEVRQGLDVGTVVVRSVNPKQSIAEGRAIQIR